MVIAVISHIGGLVVSVSHPKDKLVFDIEALKEYVRTLYNVPSIILDPVEADYQNGTKDRLNYVVYHGSNPICEINFFNSEEL